VYSAGRSLLWTTWPTDTDICLNHFISRNRSEKIIGSPVPVAEVEYFAPNNLTGLSIAMQDQSSPRSSLRGPTHERADRIVIDHR